MSEGTPAALYYELWENRSGNLIAEFDTEDDALRFVRDTVTSANLATILSWSLHRSDAPTPIAYGTALYALLDERMPA